MTTNQDLIRNHVFQQHIINRY